MGNSKPKILHVLHFCNERGTTPTVISAVKHNDQYEHHFAFGNIESDEALSQFSRYGTPKLFPKLVPPKFDDSNVPAFVEQENIDLVHLYLPGDDLPEYIKKIKVPVIMTVNCTKGCNFGLEYLAKVIVPSHYSASLNTHLDPEVVPYGMSDLAEVHSKSTVLKNYYEFEDDPEDYVVISRVGSIEHVKHVQDFFAVADMLSHVDKVLWLVGGKDPMGLIPRYQTAFGNSRVVHTGFISEQEKFNLYNASDICLYPTEFEAFGFSLLEPMIAGVPVVSYEESAIAETVGDGGVVVPFNNLEALAIATADLIARPLKRKELGRLGRQHWRKKFTSIKHAAHIDRVYKEILNEC